VQKTDAGEINWIIETKGRVWGGHRGQGRRHSRFGAPRISEQTGEVGDSPASISLSLACAGSQPWPRPSIGGQDQSLL